MQVVGRGEAGELAALCNRVTQDEAGRTGSTISLLLGKEAGQGAAWRVDQPRLIPPQSNITTSWKRGYVYGFDTIPDPANSSLLLTYYNARDGWAGARETVGLSRIKLDGVQLFPQDFK